MTDDLIDRWGRKDCHILSLAMHRETGWPIVTLCDGRFCCSHHPLEASGALVHSGVRHPDGGLLDIFGLHEGPADLLILADEFLENPERWARWDFNVDAEDLESILSDDGEDLDIAYDEAKSVCTLLQARHGTVVEDIRPGF